MIPPKLLAEAESEYNTFLHTHPAWSEHSGFIEGVRWALSRLQALAAEGFDEKHCGNFAVECTRTLPSDWSEHEKFCHSCGVGVGMRHQHALDMAALLELKEENARWKNGSAVEEIVKQSTGYLKQALAAERARAEKLQSQVVKCPACAESYTFDQALGESK